MIKGSYFEKIEQRMDWGEGRQQYGESVCSFSLFVDDKSIRNPSVTKGHPDACSTDPLPARKTIPSPRLPGLPSQFLIFGVLPGLFFQSCPYML